VRRIKKHRWLQVVSDTKGLLFLNVCPGCLEKVLDGPEVEALLQRLRLRGRAAVRNSPRTIHGLHVLMPKARTTLWEQLEGRGIVYPLCHECWPLLRSPVWELEVLEPNIVRLKRTGLQLRSWSEGRPPGPLHGGGGKRL
jgi:hypothetical protein